MTTVNQAPNSSTYDATPPHDPGLSDFNGCAKIDDSTDPPDPTTMPNAPEWQTMELTLISVARMAPQVSVSVKDAAGTYTVDLVRSKSSSIGVAQVFITKVGTGDIAVHVDASLLAPEGLRPKAYVNQDAALSARAFDYIGVDPMTSAPTRGAEVKLFTSTSGALTDGSFTVDIF